MPGDLVHRNPGRRPVMRWDPVHDSRSAFLACMWAQCAPGRPRGPVPRPGICPEPDLDGAAAILLALLDPGLSLAVVGDAASAASASAAAAVIRRETGASADPLEAADFVLVAGPTDEPVASRARRGTALMPERGATLVYRAEPTSVPAMIAGPGVDRPGLVPVALSADELRALRAANASPPAGVDAFVADGRSIVALPRSTDVRIEAG